MTPRLEFKMMHVCSKVYRNDTRAATIAIATKNQTRDVVHILNKGIACGKRYP